MEGRLENPTQKPKSRLLRKMQPLRQIQTSQNQPLGIVREIPNHLLKMEALLNKMSHKVSEMIRANQTPRMQIQQGKIV